MKKRYWLPIVFCLIIIRMAKTQSDAGSTWLASTDISIGLELNSSPQEITISTDENTKQLSVQLPASMLPAKGLRLQIIDVFGVVMLDQRLAAQSSFVELKGLPMGVYAVRIQSPSLLVEHKLNIRRHR